MKYTFPALIAMLGFALNYIGLKCDSRVVLFGVSNDAVLYYGGLFLIVLAILAHGVNSYRRS